MVSILSPIMTVKLGHLETLSLLAIMRHSWLAGSLPNTRVARCYLRWGQQDVFHHEGGEMLHKVRLERDIGSHNLARCYPL